jgi:hypothetical protein
MRAMTRRNPSGVPPAVEDVVLDPVQHADAPASPVAQGGLLDGICARHWFHSKS